MEYGMLYPPAAAAMWRMLYSTVVLRLCQRLLSVFFFPKKSTEMILKNLFAIRSERSGTEESAFKHRSLRHTRNTRSPASRSVMRGCRQCACLYTVLSTGICLSFLHGHAEVGVQGL